MKELIEEAEKFQVPTELDDEETKILPTSSSRFGYANLRTWFSQETLKIQVEQISFIKAAAVKIPREMSSIKLNKILFAVIFLLICLSLSNETFVIGKGSEMKIGIIAGVYLNSIWSSI